MKILILSMGMSPNSQALIEEALKAGHEINFFLYKDLVFNFQSKKMEILIKEEKNINKYNVIILRSPKYFAPHVRCVVYMARKLGIYVLNQDMVLSEFSPNKLSQHTILALHGLPVLKTALPMGQGNFKKAFKKIKPPIILKGITGSLGAHVYKVESHQKAYGLLKKYGLGNLLFQEFAPARQDYRILVLDDQPLGVMRRIAPPSDFRANIARGGKGEKAKLTAEMSKLAKKAAQLLKCEFCGVDIMYWQGKPYILEVNLFPQFSGFTQATKINVAQKIIKYLEKKVR